MNENKKKVPPGMLIFIDRISPFLDVMTDKDLGELFRALIRYHKTGEEIVKASPLVQAAFKNVRTSIDQNNAKYEKGSLDGAYAAHCRDKRKKNQEPLSKGQFIEMWRELQE